MPVEAEPVFPPELEHYIFSLSVHNDKAQASNLLLVAQRVYQWIIPEIFNVVVYEAFIPTFEHMPIVPSKADLMRHGKHVHHIVLSDPASDDSDEPKPDRTTAWCLSQCPNLIDLALWVQSSQFPPDLIDQLFSLRHLTHLSFSLWSLTEGLKSANRDIPHPMTSVTHLQLVKSMSVYHATKIKEIFPSVTHLAFIGAGAPKPSSKILEDVLALWGDKLKVLIWTPGLGKEVCPKVLPTSQYTHLEDPRIVILYHGNNWAGSWLRDSRGESGIWTVAEEMVRARRTFESYPRSCTQE